MSFLPLHKYAVLFTTVFALTAMATAPAATILFDLQGNGGEGLQGSSENPPVGGTPGVGGEVGAGISYDDVTMILTINVGWGVDDGFSLNLTGPATAMHIHGPTASSGPDAFLENAGVAISLAGFDSAANGGGFNNTVTLTASQEAEILAGRFYINVHTATNPGGEIRGNFVAVPEPTSLGLCLLAGSGLVALSRRRRAI